MARKRTQAVAAGGPEFASIPAESSLISRQKTLVFISHDSRDADLAEAFANLLSDVSAGTLKSFRSSDKKGTSGIEFGTEWYQAIMSQLGDATDVVALLTPRSVGRPWILYEAGVAKGKLDTNVLGLALGVPLAQVSTGPFGQFQNSGDDEDSLTKLVLQLLRRNPDAAPREEAIRTQVRIFRDATAKLLTAKDKVTAASTSASEETNMAKLFEEVKIMVRDLPERVDEKVMRHAARRGSFKRRFHPMMMEDFLMAPPFRDAPDGPALSWLIFLSAFREDFPWFYEVGLELYHALRARDGERIIAARESLLRALDAMRGPWARGMVERADEEAFMLLRHTPELVENFIKSAMHGISATRRSRPKDKDAEKVSEGRPKDGT